jgi:Uncharacterized small protein containing a coiled-coil domain
MQDIFGDEPRKSPLGKGPLAHEIGQDLSALSLNEIEERITLLKAEIARLESMREAKQASRQAANAFFR